MKKAMNARLDENTFLLVEQLVNELHLTKTEILKRSIQLFSKQNLKTKSPLLQFAGTLSDKEADLMISDIEHSKVSKDFSLDI